MASVSPPHPGGAGAAVPAERGRGWSGGRYRQSLQRATWPLRKSRQGQILRWRAWAPAQLNSRRSPWNTQCLFLGSKEGATMSLASSELWQFTSYLKRRRKGLERQGPSSALAASTTLQWGRLFGAPVDHPLTQPSSPLGSGAREERVSAWMWMWLQCVFKAA